MTENPNIWKLSNTVVQQIGTEKGFFDWVREHIATSTLIIATQIEVDSGIIDNKFVTPLTLTNWVGAIINWGDVAGNLANQLDLQEALNDKQGLLGFIAVPNTRTVNTHPLSSDVTVTQSDVGLGDVNNTSDLGKPISTATQTALNDKENTLGFTPVPSTRTINGFPLSSNITLSKSDIGLGNVDNTSDANKPVSTAEAILNALNLKIVSNLSDLSSIATARTNLGMGIASGTITRAAATASGTQTITLLFKPSFILFSTVDDSDTHISSDGWDDSSIGTCTWNNAVTLLATLISTSSKDHTNSIHIQTIGGAGHSALITGTSLTGFTLTWTKIGAGRSITVKYLAFN